jgi:hypothetical protein
MTTQAGVAVRTQADERLGRRIKATLIALTLLAVAAVLVAGRYWDYLGRITVTPTRAADVITVTVDSLSGRTGNADLEAVVRTTTGRTLRLQADVAVPGRGLGRHAFDFGPLLGADEEIESYKVKK